jgi:hypothetical protein
MPYVIDITYPGAPLRVETGMIELAAQGDDGTENRQGRDGAKAGGTFGLGACNPDHLRLLANC